MFVSDILRTKGGSIHSGTPDMTVGRAANEMTGRKIGSLLILDGGSIAGILSERDIVRGLATFGAECLDGPVTQLMTRGVTTIGPGATIAQAMEIMTQGRFRHLPVMDGDTLAGMISIGDVVKYRLAEATREVEEMQKYVQGQYD
ncbi:MAG: CBS domain-containing protein [Rhodospirillaceae bacterium]|nr:CBS domain-containing protein [Rhodospirillaceae bacterium]MCY4067178.1 CBS domain-containing protein [Rhodospirillaceae bacterium]MDE0704233.1 CBS domain-containing protein [Rhodospirillaceae bacterium]MYG52854.1 CBS domain-containing protein [Rhodospirillaceae bacterium]